MADNPLSESDKQSLRDTLKQAKEALESLTDFERAGLDVKQQREKLNEIISRTNKILDVFGN